MKPSAPKKNVWWIALIVGVVGIVSHFIAITYISPLSFWLTAIAFVILLLATSMKGL